MFSQLSRRFDHLQMKDRSSLSKSIDQAFDRVFLRNGEINEEELEGTPYSIDNRQENVASESCQSFKQLDLVNEKAEDMTFRLGDIVHIRSMDRFGTIDCLLRNESSKLADIVLFRQHEFDEESMIPFADSIPTAEKSMHHLHDISEPLATAVEEDLIYFISHEHENIFPWLSDHLKH